MASRISVSSRAALSSSLIRPGGRHEHRLAPSVVPYPVNRRIGGVLRIAAKKGGGKSYLYMWKNAVDREKKEIEFRRLVERSAGGRDDGEEGKNLGEKSEEFKKILDIPREERDRVQRMQIIDRASAAIAAARSILAASNSRVKSGGLDDEQSDRSGGIGARRSGLWKPTGYVGRSEISGTGIPGPDFWSWTPPLSNDTVSANHSDLQPVPKSKAHPSSTNHTVEKERSAEFLRIPFESKLIREKVPVLPPFQSFIEGLKDGISEPSSEAHSLNAERDLEALSSAHAAEAAHALGKPEESSYGVNPDGSKWWKQSGIEQRPDGVICRWTMNRGVSADYTVEWQDKYWEASDEFGYKELGSEKSGRDAFGNVWREFWRESMLQEHGIMHLEKTADKWGKNADGAEWQEKWWEHYDASGRTDKWAHKWCSIDPNTPLEAGHAHVWHERWGEKYDGEGGSIKYTDKWAERCEEGGWTKWGDKWDENFDPNGHGVKQGETWWAGKHGERWNRTWGERHNGSGWVHKYGKSSSGEHWDTHVQQETWYERFPHYGFFHCLENSVQLRAVRKPSEIP